MSEHKLGSAAENFVEFTPAGSKFGCFDQAAAEPSCFSQKSRFRPQLLTSATVSSLSARN
jgi:hypothetical protein